MEELMQLRSLLEAGRMPEAMLLLAEMEEMSKDDKISKIESFLQVLLIHLVKQQVEKRTTRSWEVSILNSVNNIRRANKRRNAGGFYIGRSEMLNLMDEIFIDSIRYASLEALEGRFDAVQLSDMIDRQKIKEEAVKLIEENQGL